jgi:3-phosphoglycerate kinase
MFTKQTITDVKLTGKRVLMRAEFDVPLTKSGTIANDKRIRSSLPTIEYLLKQDCSIVIIAHLGRPGGKKDYSLSLKQVAKRLGELLKKPVKFVDEAVGPVVQTACKSLKAGQVLLLENVRFYPGEEQNDHAFAEAIVSDTKAQFFVQECFGVAHRRHASVVGCAALLPNAAGLLLAEEVDVITSAIKEPKRPLLAIVGGAKISDKIDVIKTFVGIADMVAVTGAMANTFLLAQGLKVGTSLVEKDAVETAKEILLLAAQKAKKQRFSFLVPEDVVVASAIDAKAKTRIVDLSGNTFADIEAYPKRPLKESVTVGANEAILDIGPMSAAKIAGACHMAAMVLWNGTAGVTEVKGLAGAADPFAHGTNAIIEALIGDDSNPHNKPFTVVGGGDTVGYLEERGLAMAFDHVSTGGGASLELMAGHELPGVAVLMDKKA